MKITAVKGWYPLDEIRSFAIGRDYRGDLEEALAAQYACDSPSCDICHALEAGFPLVAADLLSSAIEAPLLLAVERAHRFNRTFDAGDPNTERERWLEYFNEAEEKGLLWMCASCGASNWGSESCGWCMALRPRLEAHPCCLLRHGEGAGV